MPTASSTNQTHTAPGVICVCNTRSGRRPASKCLPDLREILSNNGIHLEIVDLSDGFEDRLETTLSQREWLAVGGIGGDGTHLACFNALLNAKKKVPQLSLPPYAVIPFGTGNNLAKSLKLTPGPRHLDHAIDIMLRGDTLAMDLGTWDEGWFCDGLTIGLDAEILSRRDNLQKKYGHIGLHGYALYGLGTLQAIPGYCPPTATITAGDELWHRGSITNFLVNNCRVYAGEFTLTPDARVDDGVLDAVCLTHQIENFVSYLRSWRHLPLGGCAHRIRKGTQFTITVDRPLPVQVDGECFSPRQTVAIGIDPKAVMVKVPQGLYA